jgi:excisionase family DNA binding protein
MPNPGRVRRTTTAIADRWIQAERLGTTERFVRRLVFERRIAYVKLGRHVRIAGRDLDAFIRAGRVEVGQYPTLRRGA